MASNKALHSAAQYWSQFSLTLVRMTLHTRSLLITLAAIVLLGASGCSTSDQTPVVSPSGSYSVSASVDTKNRQSRNYAIVMLHLVGESGEEFLPVRTGAGDAQKWALGWMPTQDVVVLYSSDIGTLAYEIEDTGLVRIDKLSDDIRRRADELYSTKYDRVPPSRD